MSLPTPLTRFFDNEKQQPYNPVSQGDVDEDGDALVVEDPLSEPPPRRRFRNTIIAAGVGVLTLIIAGLFISYESLHETSPYKTHPTPKRPASKNAFITFLSANNHTMFGGAGDQYFQSTRLLNWQLRHAELTRAQTDIAFVVMVTEHVTKPWRQQLTAEGATVFEGSDLTPEWVSRGILIHRWSNMMNKLHLAQMTQYDKVCFIDADTLIIERFDDIFDDPALQPHPTNFSADPLDPTDHPSPEEYTFAAIRDAGTPESIHYFNAGFFCMKPSLFIFDHYMSVLHRPKSFNPIMAEQQLLNTIHAPDGQMPWQSLPKNLNTNKPNDKELANGLKTLHGKLWMPADDDERAVTEHDVRQLWQTRKAEMDAYFADE